MNSAAGKEIETLTRKIMIKHYDRIKSLSDQVPGRKWTKEELLAERPGKWERSCIARVGDEIVGLCICSQKGDSCHYHMIVVDESYRKMGVGISLVRSLVERASKTGDEFITTKVDPGNKYSLGFKQRIGFEVYGEEFVEEESITYLLLRGKPERILEAIEKKRYESEARHTPA